MTSVGDQQSHMEICSGFFSHGVGMEPALATVWRSHLRSLVKGYGGRGLPERFSWSCFHVIWRAISKHLVVIKRKEGKAKRKREKH